MSRLFPPEYDYIMADPGGGGGGGGGVNGMASNHIAKSKFVRTFNYGHTKLLKCALLDIQYMIHMIHIREDVHTLINHLGNI